MTKERPDWEKLELIVAELQRQLAPSAEVRHNHRVTGKSGRRRKLDVTVTEKIGTYPIFIVFDCKRHKRTIKMKDIESFAGQVEDVNANLGVMISDSGFDAGAKAVAAQKKIVLQTYRKAEETDWKATVGENAWLFLTQVEMAEVKATVLLPNCASPYEVPFNVLIFNENQEVLDNLKDLFWKIWKAPGSTRSIGYLTAEVDSLVIPLFILNAGELLRIEKFIVQTKLIARKYPVNLQLAGGNILEDVVAQKPVYSDLASQGFDWADIMNTQPGIEISPEEYQEELRGSGIFADLSNAKKYLRVRVTNKKEP